jgi:arginyl-tRNA synthetase
MFDRQMSTIDRRDPKRLPRSGTEDIVTVVRDKILAANTQLIEAGILPKNIDQSRVVVELPRDPSHGDFASNNAIVLAGQAKKKPAEIAEANAAILRNDPFFKSVSVAGQGFENVTISPHVLTEFLRDAILLGPAYGRRNLGCGRRVNVEYVSANPTGPMHVGHGRGAVFGDALANLLTFTGFDVTREYYINDAGAQIDALARSVFWRYRELLGEEVGPIPEGLYPGEYVKEAALLVGQEYGHAVKGRHESEWLPVVRSLAIKTMMRIIKEDLDALNVKHDVFSSERSLIEGPRNIVGETIAALRRAGYVYEGRLPRPRGPVEDWEDREQTLFRATDFGDEVDRPLMKSDGSYTYFASDIAYHKDKIDRRFATLIDVWGADHVGYIKRVQAAVKAVQRITNAPVVDLDIKIVQMVKLLRAGKPVKMSKRAGEFVTLRDVVNEVGKDAVRFMMLYRHNDAMLDFDLAKVREQSRDNPVFYVQYGHARGHSVFHNARQVIPDLPRDPQARAQVLAGAPLERLTDSGELALMRRLALYPRLVEGAAIAHEPHRVAFYLYDLASDFHAQWNRGEDRSYLRFIIQNDPLMTAARLALVQGVVSVLASGLGMLGVEAPDEMR